LIKRFDVKINNTKLYVDITYELKGKRKLNDYLGVFELNDRELLIKVSAKSILKGALKIRTYPNLKTLLRILFQRT
jgi:hypothetical protein